MRSRRTGYKGVQWKGGDAATIRTKRPHPLVGEAALDASLAEEFAQYLVPGALWFTKNVLRPDDRWDRDHELHEFKYLVADHYWGAPGSILPSSMAVYAGTHRVSEADRHGSIVRVLRQSFIVGGTRYITSNLNDFFPCKG